MTITRDPSMFTLWWTSTDRQAAIDPAKKELRGQSGCGAENFDEGSWIVEPPAQDE